MNKRMKSAVRAAVIITAALIASASLTITFANSKSIPAWKDICSFLGLSETPRGNYVRIIDVGQGDCILISSGGRTALIDCGTDSSQGNLCGNLKSLGAKAVDALIVSHMHDDHSGGIDALCESFEIKNLIVPDTLKTDESVLSLERAKKQVIKSGGKVFTAVQGMNMKVGEFTVTVIAYYSDETLENNRSVAVLAEAQEIRFLFTGDGERDFEERIASDKLNIDCDVLKVAHHGADTATTSAFLKLCTPRFAAISCGEANLYGHPHADTLERLDNIGAEVLRTDISGDITFYVENGELSFETEK